MNQDNIIYSFSKSSAVSEWQIINDEVMGGLSKSELQITQEGYGMFSGQVSLENYGGFASMRYSFDLQEIGNYSKFLLKIKGDGKRYQLRVKPSSINSHSYIQYFHTNGEWQIIEIPFQSMHASFRGRKLDYPNFNGKIMEEISILIGNKKEEKFKILLDKISLQ